MSDRLATRATTVLVVVLLAVTVVGLVLGEGRPRDRAAELDRRLRCPVCTAVSIADSPSETAAAMRRTVAEQVEAGRSDAEIIAYFRARYGDWVLLDPPARGRTVWLFALPAAAAVGGAALVLTRARRTLPAAPVSAADRARVAAALAALPDRPDDDEEP